MTAIFSNHRNEKLDDQLFLDQIERSLPLNRANADKRSIRKAIHNSAQAQINAIAKTGLGIDVERVKTDKFDLLVRNGVSKINAYYYVYDVEVFSAKGIVRVLTDTVNYVSDRVTEPVLRGAVTLIAPSRPAPSRPPSPAAVPAPAAEVATPRRSPPPVPPKPPGIAKQLARARRASTPAAEVAPRVSCCAKAAFAAVSGVKRGWGAIPERPRKWVEETLLKEFFKDPIKDIARKTTTGVVVGVSYAFSQAITGGIVAAASGAYATAAGAARTAMSALRGSE